MSNSDVAKDIANGAYNAVQWLSYIEVEDDVWDDVTMFDHNQTDFSDVVQGIIPAIEEWIEGKTLPPTDDYVDLGEDLALSIDPLSFTDKYGEEYKGLADTFPEINVDFWMEDGLVRAELNSVWMRYE